MDESVVKEIAASPARSTTNRPTNSAAKCWASAALPPLPKNRSLPPACKHLVISPAASKIAAPQSRATTALSVAPSRREELIRSMACSRFLISGIVLLLQPRRCQLTSSNRHLLSSPQPYSGNRGIGIVLDFRSLFTEVARKIYSEVTANSSA